MQHGTSLVIIFNTIAGEINNLKVKSLNLVVWVLIIEGKMEKIASLKFYKNDYSINELNNLEISITNFKFTTKLLNS